jgi:hypothetical protein
VPVLEPPAAREPLRDVGGAAAELDHVEIVDAVEHVDLGPRDAPDAPRGLVRGPVLMAGAVELLSVAVPRHGVPEQVFAGPRAGKTLEEPSGEVIA